MGKSNAFSPKWDISWLVKRLKDLRESKGLSQGELGKIIGFSTNAISYYETGAREPSIETIKKLCEFFNVSAGYLIGTED